MTAELLVSRELTVALDHGQFYLYTADADPDRTVAVMEDALGPQGIAQRDGVAVVISPHQNNFKMAFHVEVWSAEPAIDLDQWQEAFELHLDVSEFGLKYDSTVPDFKDLGVPAGSYHALITGRDFGAHGWPGSATPGDKWRIRLFPSDGPAEARRIREWIEPTFVPPAPEFRDAGVAAVRRLHQALDDPTSLSGRRGTVRVERTLPGTRRVLFKGFQFLHGWLTQGGGGDDSGYLIGGGYPDEGNPFSDSNQIVASDGCIRCKYIDIQAPGLVEVSWSWEAPEARRMDAYGNNVITAWKALVPFEPQMTLRVELANGTKTPDWPTTTVTVTHDQVPEEFVDDLAAYWLWKLEDADYGFDLGKQRMKRARAASANA